MANDIVAQCSEQQTRSFGPLLHFDNLGLSCQSNEINSIYVSNDIPYGWRAAYEVKEYL